MNFFENKPQNPTQEELVAEFETVIENRISTLQKEQDDLIIDFQNSKETKEETEKTGDQPADECIKLKDDEKQEKLNGIDEEIGMSIEDTFINDQITDLHKHHIPVFMYISAYYHSNYNNNNKLNIDLYVNKSKINIFTIFEGMIARLKVHKITDESAKQTLDTYNAAILKIKNNFKKIQENSSEDNDFIYDDVNYITTTLDISDAIIKIGTSIGGILYYGLTGIIYNAIETVFIITAVGVGSVATCGQPICAMVDMYCLQPSMSDIYNDNCNDGFFCTHTRKNIHSLFYTKYETITKMNNDNINHLSNYLQKKNKYWKALVGIDNEYNSGGNNKTKKRRRNKQKLANKTKRSRKNKTHKKIVRKKRSNKLKQKSIKRK
jgi:hypothetical protein